MKAKVKLFIDVTPAQLRDKKRVYTDEQVITIFYDSNDETTMDDVHNAVIEYVHAKRLPVYKYEILDVSGV